MLVAFLILAGTYLHTAWGVALYCTAVVTADPSLDGGLAELISVILMSAAWPALFAYVAWEHAQGNGRIW